MGHVEVILGSSQVIGFNCVILVVFASSGVGPLCCVVPDRSPTHRNPLGRVALELRTINTMGNTTLHKVYISMAYLTLCYYPSANRTVPTQIVFTL